MCFLGYEKKKEKRLKKKSAKGSNNDVPPVTFPERSDSHFKKKKEMSKGLHIFLLIFSLSGKHILMIPVLDGGRGQPGEE